jgi:ATP-dependent DNA helicase RecG
MSENQNKEFKQTWRDEYLKWICGFANADGGSILVGVKDDGSITGVKDFKKLLEDIPNKARNIMGITVSILLLEYHDKKYLKIITPPYHVPVSLRGRYYQRSGSTNQELNGNTLNEFLIQRFGKAWDSVTEESFSISDIDIETIERFKRLAVDRLPLIAEEKDLQLILNKLNLIHDGKFKRAAILLFGKNPQRLFLQAHIKIGRFISEADIITSDIVEGNLFQQVEQALSILKSKYLVSPITYEGIHRREKLELPYIALREALLNAIIHRNYMTTSAMQVRIYDDK